MVQMAIKDLEDNDVIKMDADKKASMVSNLLVVLCGEEKTQPVLTTNC